MAAWLSVRMAMLRLRSGHVPAIERILDSFAYLRLEYIGESWNIARLDYTVCI